MQSHTPIERVAVVLTAVALLFSLGVAVTGQVWVVQSTEISGEVRQFNPALLLPVVGAAAALLYTWRKDTRSVWLIGIALLFLAALFVFSFVLVLLPTALAVLTASALLSVSRRSERRRANIKLGDSTADA